MSKIPIRQCPKCELYSDISVLKCKCGENLEAIDAKLVETDDLKDEEKGEINEDVIAFVQTCPNCGTLNFTHSSKARVRKCRSCKGRGVVSIKPEEYTEEKNKDPEPTNGPKEPSWGEILKQVKNATNKRNITFREKDGDFSFKIDAEEAKDNAPYMLGREANQSSFFKKDERVSRNHCSLVFKDGLWYVKDNNSTNGTFVNSKNIGKNGEKVLEDGDELRLGHIIFKISFKAQDI